jgi:hypothetical protein
MENPEFFQASRFSAASLLKPPALYNSRKYAKAGLKKAPDYKEVYRQMTVD